MAAGCGSGTDSAVWAGSVTDSSGVEIVANQGTGLWAEADRWRFEDVLQIGSAEGEPEYQFGQISGVVVTGGEIFVLDQQASQVRVFGEDGVFRRSFGGRGGGPGELGPQAGPLLQASGDTLIVPDITNQRALLYGVDGTSHGSYRLSLENGIPVRWESTPQGTIVSQVRAMPLPGMPAQDPVDGIVARGSDGSITDTLLTVPSGKTFSFSGGAPEFHFFSPEPAWALYPGGKMLYGLNSEYRIGLYDADGSLERIVTMPFDRAPVGEDDRDVFTDVLKRLWAEAGVPPQAITQLTSRVNFADTYPAYLQILAGPDGSIWVQHIQSIGELTPDERETFNPLVSLGASEWDVFDEAGRFLGTLELPSKFQPLRFVGDEIWGIWRDELDVQHVRGMQVVRGGT